MEIVWMINLLYLQERDNMQKSEFLKALSDMWKDFDSRVLRYKVELFLTPSISFDFHIVLCSFSLLSSCFLNYHEERNYRKIFEMI